MGHTIWSTKKSSSDSRHYAKYGKQSGHQHDPIELRSKPRKKVDVHGFTIHDRDESEESIVDRDAPIGYTSSGSQSGSYDPSRGVIIKTNAVSVTYEQGAEGPTSGARQWAAI